MRWLRPAVYLWAFPTTLLGLLFLPEALISGAARWVDGVLEIHGRMARVFLACVRASAMTLGHVVIARDQALLDLTRSHERVHVRQCERWGPLFVPAYLGISLLLWCRGKRAYYDNPFEKEAFRDANR